MKFRTIASSVAVVLLATSLAGAGDSPAEKQAKIRKMAAETLKELYKKEPPARAQIQKSAGYAVFNNTGTNILLVSTARGAGIAINTSSKQETFMKMVSAAPVWVWE